jgi:hypothetical protein
MQTPCTKVCILDDPHGRCRGCGRTADEIARWTTMTAAERAAIMAMLPARQTEAAGLGADQRIMP